MLAHPLVESGARLVSRALARALAVTPQHAAVVAARWGGRAGCRASARGYGAAHRRIMELHYLVSVESLPTRIQQGLGVAKSLAQH
jgi:hypothetical protein